MLCVLLTCSRMITHLTLALQAMGKKSIGRYRPIIFPFLRHRLLVLTFIYIFPLRVFINLSICAKRPFPHPSNHYQIQTTSSNIEIHETSPAVRILVITYSWIFYPSICIGVLRYLIMFAYAFPLQLKIWSPWSSANLALCTFACIKQGDLLTMSKKLEKRWYQLFEEVSTGGVS